MKEIHNKYSTIVIFLMLLFCTVSVSSCSREIEPEGNSETAISFNSKVGKTKALVNEIADMIAFQVYGYYTDDAGVSQNTAFDGDVVTRSGSIWEYSPSRYWIKDAKYSFAAFHPFNANVTNINNNLDSDGKFENLSFEYEKSGFQDDFMLAVKDITSEDATNGDCSVKLSFEHILSNIKVKIGLASSVQPGTYFRINSVTLNGMKRHATYTSGTGWSDFSSAALQFSANVEDVLLNKQLDNKVYNNTTELTDGCINPTGEDGLTVIPVDLTNQNNVVTLRLNCEVSNDGTNYTQKIIEKKFIATSGVNAWEIGKSYTYVALLDMDYNISFSEPTVTEWVNEQATGSVIIK